MKTVKGCAAIVIMGVALIATLAIGTGSVGGVDLWFIQGTFDRVNPLAAQATVYAQTPAPDACFDSYTDATGSGDNYVYEVRAYDENGTEHKASLISFGGKLNAAEPYLKLTVKGTFVQSWEPIDADALPAAVAQALE